MCRRRPWVEEGDGRGCGTAPRETQIDGRKSEEPIDCCVAGHRFSY